MMALTHAAVAGGRRPNCRAGSQTRSGAALLLLLLAITTTTTTTSHAPRTSTVAAAVVADTPNIFGIGNYFPPGIVGQNANAQQLVGDGGWVLILVPVGLVTATTPLPPACPGYSTSQALTDAYARNLTVVVRLEPQYGASDAVQCFKGVGPLRDLADAASNHTAYTTVAATYATALRSLPRPPDGSPVYVQIGNELNLAWDCGCPAVPSLGPSCMTAAQAAAEAAAFLRDSLAALRQVGNIKLAASPIAPIGWDAKKCCANATGCPSTITTTALEFERLMLAAEPKLWSNADWLSSHSYPCAAPGCGLASSMPCTGWNAPYDVAAASGSLTLYQQEAALLQPSAGRKLPAIITETGWSRDCCTEADRANWTVHAYQNLWLPDSRDSLLAVTPFLMQGAQWAAKGFPWVSNDDVPLPVFNATRKLRCAALPTSGGCGGGSRARATTTDSDNDDKSSASPQPKATPTVVPLWGLFEASPPASTAPPTPVSSNPFDTDVVSVVLHIVPPVSARAGGRTDGTGVIIEGQAALTVDVQAFWYQNYTVSFPMPDHNETLTPLGDPHWLARFTPAHTGVHTYWWSRTDASGTHVSANATFSVVPPVLSHVEGTPSTTAHGFARVSASNARRFALDDGSPLYPVGLDICMYERRSNVTLWAEEWLGALSAAGGSFARVWALDNENTTAGMLAIEKFAAGKDYDLESAWRLDYVMAVAERLGIRVMLTLNDQHTYRVSRRWNVAPYNVANGGPLAKPQEILTSPAALQLMQRRLRYIVARYGYATSLLAFELWNEVDFVDGYTTAAAKTWHATMAQFLQAIDPNDHMVTTSYGWERGDPAVQGIPDLAFVSTHHYDNSTFGGDMAAFIYGIEASKRALFPTQPHFVGEYGVGLGPPQPPQWPALAGLGLHNGLWASIASMSGASALSWFWEALVDASDLWFEYQRAAAFTAQVDPEGAVTDWSELAIDFGDDHGTRARCAATSGQFVRAMASVGVAPAAGTPGVRDTAEAVVWLQNTNHTWRRQWEGLTPVNTVVPCNMTVRGLLGGAYTVSWFPSGAPKPARGVPDAVAAEASPPAVATVQCSPGWCIVPTPSFTTDVAAHLQRAVAHTGVP